MTFHHLRLTFRYGRPIEYSEVHRASGPVEDNAVKNHYPTASKKR